MTTSREEFVRAAWEKYCPGASALPDSNFFAAGGDSLDLIHLLYEVSTELDIAVRLEDFISHPTLECLIDLVSESPTSS
jgi:acyl carrier protein